MESMRLGAFVGTWLFVYFLLGSCVTSVFGMEWNPPERYGLLSFGVSSHLILLLGRICSWEVSKWLKYSYSLGGVLHSNIPICDAGGVACPWPYITRSKRRHYVLPLPRPVSPRWPRGMIVAKKLMWSLESHYKTFIKPGHTLMLQSHRARFVRQIRARPKMCS